jgi:hypothetical protein
LAAAQIAGVVGLIVGFFCWPLGGAAAVGVVYRLQFVREIPSTAELPFSVPSARPKYPSSTSCIRAGIS